MATTKAAAPPRPRPGGKDATHEDSTANAEETARAALRASMIINGECPGATGKAIAEPTRKLDALIRAEPDLVDRIFDYVVEIMPSLAERECEVKCALREEFGGREVYIRRKQSSTALDVLRLFNGRNQYEIARRLDVHLKTVYRILKQHGRAA
jgi:hypothetical protein